MRLQRATSFIEDNLAVKCSVVLRAITAYAATHVTAHAAADVLLLLHHDFLKALVRLILDDLWHLDEALTLQSNALCDLVFIIHHQILFHSWRCALIASIHMHICMQFVYSAIGTRL